MHILLVEGIRSIAAVMASRLTLFGHEFTLAENGQIALELFQAATPNLILMDIKCP